MLTNNKAIANTSLLDNVVGLTMSPQTIEWPLVIMVDQQRK
jgi:hypothetical protein